MSQGSFFAKIRNSRCARITCAFIALNIVIEIVSPTMAMALTAGPTAPEFTSFEPVATTDMVNDFSGDFTYNIPVLNVPGPDGGGYSMSLAYHSGSSSEEEASWVGFGWTLNPGAINRNKRGYPDEFKNIPVETYNKSKPNWTSSSHFNINIEISSKDGKNEENNSSDTKNKDKAKKLFHLSPAEKEEQDKYNQEVSLSYNHTVRYNNYSGFSIANGLGVGVKGMANVSMNRSGGQNTFGFSVNPIAIMGAISKSHQKDKEENKKKWKGKIDKLYSKLNKLSGNGKKERKLKVKLPGAFPVHTFNVPALPYSVAKNIGTSWNFNASVVLNPANFPLGGQIGFGGNMNMQVMEGYQSLNTYGYLNSDIANTNTADGVLLDYQVEKETTFNKHDKNLGIPFNNADVFSSTGNGITGGFRFHHQNIGTYYPNFQTSVTNIRQLGVELGIGSDIQIGLTVGIGRQSTKVKGAWPFNAIGAFTPTFSPAQNASLRFMNDAGGELDYNATNGYDSPVTSTISILGGLGTATSDFSLTANSANASTSSDIQYLQANPTYTDLITGMIITNKDGAKSHYTKPVYTRNEAELTVGVSSNQDGAYLVTQQLDFNNPMKNSTVVGTKTPQMYANSYLLEQNTTFNYIDVNGNGKADENDFGGWTKFAYRQVYGGINQWYRYRTPYAGLHYNPGRQLDLNDQTGSMSSGEKEVYYLKCIETKSHIAFFVTNATSLSDFPQADYPFLYDPTNNQPLTHLIPALLGSGTPRYDGIDAAGIDGNGNDMAAASLTAKGTHSLQKLERIVLFAKSDMSKPLTTTFFEYDYSLCQGIPNSSAPASAPAKDKGKLTLKRVWTESNGVNRSQISPYIFNYEYFNQYPSQLCNKYSFLTTYTAMPSNDPLQNPAYKQEQLDAWGNYQVNGAQRFANMQHWLWQGTPDPSFDPAVWQLKRIQLPSGGEIHVHYEQKDYISVQDKDPMAMVSLLPDNMQNGYKSDETVYCINHSDLGIPNDGTISQYYSQLREYFITNNNKLYFKALYSFVGNDNPQLNANNERYEYVSGYTKVNDVTLSGGKVFLSLGDERTNLLEPILGEGKRDKTLPRYVCYQELLSNGGYNLGMNASSYKSKDFTSAVYPSSNTAVNQFDVGGEVFTNLFGNTLNMFGDWIKGDIKNAKRNDACKSLNTSLSYFKLPVFYAKKGGGIRVKRILTYDKGIETGDPMLFGSEYSYKGIDGRSSGVATNEPSGMREENALVHYMERKKQKFIDKIMNGRDTKQFEGPLGESIMPSAEVGHERIVITNIHSGKTTTGFAVNEYITCRTAPMEVDYTQIKKKPGGGGTYKKFALSLPLGIFNMDIQRAWVTQGYVFKLNDMHGKISSKATYAGVYAPNSFNPATFTSKTAYQYSNPGESISSLLFDKPSGNIMRGFLSPGTEEDYTIFSSNVTERTCDFSIELDWNLSYLSLYPSFSPSFSYSDLALRQHVTSKVVNQVSYLLSTTNITDGVAQTTENLAFDRYTGDPVLTRTFDGYRSPQGEIFTENSGPTKHNGFYYSLNIPASWMYSSMEPKYNNPANTNQLTTMAGNVVTYGSNSLFDYLAASPLNFVWSPTANPLTNVVSASATTFTNNWFAGTNTVMAATYTALATASVQANQFYYPLQTFSYRDNVVNSNGVSGKIYSGGTVNTPFVFFDWIGQQQVSPPPVPQQWYSDSRITKYSPYGYPVEEEDVLAIKSSAQFGYNDVLPVAVCQNSGFNQSKFIDFEYGSQTGVTTAAAHTGRASLDLQTIPVNYAFVSSYPLTNDIISKRGLAVKLWVKSSQSNLITSPIYNLKNPNPQLKIKIGSALFSAAPVAQTGEWTLYSAEIKNFYTLAPGNYPVSISYNKLPNELVYVDDFRIQPLDASMNCSVYNSDNKLAAQFDDQHFGVLYEYDNKGQLTRKSIETALGKKTLQEQQYNTPLINK